MKRLFLIIVLLVSSFSYGQSEVLKGFLKTLEHYSTYNKQSDFSWGNNLSRIVFDDIRIPDNKMIRPEDLIDYLPNQDDSTDDFRYIRIDSYSGPNPNDWPLNISYFFNTENGLIIGHIAYFNPPYIITTAIGVSSVSFSGSPNEQIEKSYNQIEDVARYYYYRLMINK
tara:strand:- start:4076 stop:4582 length:507 start_codon:yes stop_codon:yes gene_type:complete